MSVDSWRVLTVRQPWAWAIIHGGKDVENRSRSLGPYCGPVLIHAGLAEFEKPNQASRLHAELHGSSTDTQIVFGAIIGVVDLVGVHHAEDCHTPRSEPCSLWAMEEHYHLELKNPRPLKPIPTRGKLGLWRPDAQIISEVTKQLGEPK